MSNTKQMLLIPRFSIILLIAPLFSGLESSGQDLNKAATYYSTDPDVAKYKVTSISEGRFSITMTLKKGNNRKQIFIKTEVEGLYDLMSGSDYFYFKEGKKYVSVFTINRDRLPGKYGMISTDKKFVVMASRKLEMRDELKTLAQEAIDLLDGKGKAK